MKTGLLNGSLIVLLMLCSGAFADTRDYLVQARRLIEVNQPRQAYELLKSIEVDAIGEPEYDHMLASVCTSIGADDEATLVFERILQLDPAAINARIELAKSYAALGNYEQAKYQLDKILGAITNTELLQQVYTELALVDEKLAKRRRRPVFDPNAASQFDVAKPSSKTNNTALIGTANISDDLHTTMATAQALLRDGQPLAAYQVLMQLEYEGSGNVEFDYLLGVAALEAGKPDKATLALERVLASNPNYAGARVDMGRAFTALGDTVRANDEFSAVLALNPPEIVRKRVAGFIQEINRSPDRALTYWSGFFGVTIGRDSNVNNAPGHADQFIPGLLNTVVLDFDSVETPSNFSALAGRIQVDHRVSERLSVYAGLDLNLRRNFQAPQFDSSGGDLRFGSIVALIKHELEFSLALGKSFLDPQPGQSNTFFEHPLYRNVFAASAQWRFNLNEKNQLQTNLQYSRLRYLDESTKVFDTDQAILGLNWFRAFGDNGKAVGFVGGYVGKESDIHENPSGGKDFFGLRAGGQYAFTSIWTVFATLGLMSAEYQRFQAIHQKTRDDKRFDLNFGMNYALWENWSLRPQFNLTRNNSSIGLYEFDRKEVSVTLMREWR